MAWWTFQTVTALAGFYVGEQYHVPWAEVDVPQELQGQLFPFVEVALAQVKTSNPVKYGTVNFLELLQQLQPFFWQVSVCLMSSCTVLTCDHGSKKGCCCNPLCLSRVCPYQEA